MIEKRGQGKCAKWDHDSRLDFQDCNTFDCRELIPATRTTVRCSAKIDVFIILDGSGSLGRYGWQESKEMAKKLTESMMGGDDRVNMAVLLFSGPRNWRILGDCTGSDPNKRPNPVDCGMRWVDHLTPNLDQVYRDVQNMNWPRRTTLTSLALAETGAEIIYGRPDAKSVVVVITDGKPMSPIKTGMAADELKKKARLMWVPVGKGVKSSIEDMKRWASKPARDNVLVVDTFASLKTPTTLNNMISGFCPQLE